MKIKFLQFEYEFDRDDAKFVVPIILLALAFFFTELNRPALLILAIAYYAALFFGPNTVVMAIRWRDRVKTRCPKCGNRKIYLQGYQGHNSDEQHLHFYCDNCKTTSILTDGGLLEI